MSYYVLLLSRKAGATPCAIGPFPFRLDAYDYAANRLGLDTTQYSVVSDRVAQQDFQHLPIVKPD